MSSYEALGDETVRLAVARLDALSADDPEVAHSRADDILLTLMPDEVRLAYARLVDRCTWWATA